MLQYLENYISLHDWITGLGFTEKRSQFSQFRDTTSNTPAKAGNQPPVDRIGSATPDAALYSDGYLMLLSNKNNPVVQIDFQDMFPTTIGALSYSQAATDVDYLTMTASFEYKIFTLTTL